MSTVDTARPQTYAVSLPPPRMYRRIVGRTAAAVAVTSLAGCFSVEGPFEEESTENNTTTEPDDTMANETPTETDVIDNDRVAASTLTRTGDCSEAGVATVTFSDADPELTVSGCLRGHNGCAQPVVDSASETDDSVRIVMGEADLSGPDTFCTEALVQRGYELHLRFMTELPSTIEVVHDDVDGRTVVATADRP